MSFEAWVTLGVVIATLTLLSRDRYSPALVVLGAVVALLVLGVVAPAQAFSGFSNPAPFTVAGLYVLARAVEKTGALQPLVAGMMGRGLQPRRSLARLLAPVAAASAILNNTPIVAMVSPQVAAWAERRGRSASRYLMPLSFAAILGGLCTVIGTSTTIVVSGLLQAEGLEPIGLFEIGKVGLPLAVLGLILLILLGPVLLPDRKGALRSFEDEVREFSVDMVVQPGGAMDGKTVQEAELRQLQGVFLVEVDRGDEIVAPATPDTVLRGGDRLTFAGRVDQILDLQAKRGLVSAERKHTLELHDAGHTYFEAVIGAASPLNGSTLKEVDFRRHFGAAVLAIHRSGHRIRAKLGEVTLHQGDTLLLLARDDFQDLWRDRSHFLLVAKLGGLAPTSGRQAWVVAALLAAVVGLAASGLVPILEAALLGAFLTVILRVLTPREAGHAVDLDVVLLIAGAFGLGAAVEASGLARLVADGITSGLGFTGAAGALLGVVLGTLLLTEVITNNAAAVLVFPVALTVAGDLGYDPRPFAMAVAVAASASFLTPIGYQTNTMVYGPGGYRFTDYARLGFPLTVLVVVAAVVLIPVMWPL